MKISNKQIIQNTGAYVICHGLIGKYGCTHHYGNKVTCFNCIFVSELSVFIKILFGIYKEIKKNESV